MSFLDTTKNVAENTERIDSMKNNFSAIPHTLPIPGTLITAELEGLYGQNVLRDMGEIIKLYEIYENGADFALPTDNGATPTDLRFKMSKALIDKEARFMFSKPPDFFVDPVFTDETEASRDEILSILTTYQDLVDTVLKKNLFSAAIIKAAKDCFVGKRVALILNVNEQDGIQVNFLPSLEFVYDVDPKNINNLTKLIAFFGLNDAKAKQDQRIYKKKYWIQNGVCYYNESVYNGAGDLVEEIQPDTATLFSYIPAWVIVNDGLTGDLLGQSEIEDLQEFESWFNKMASGDIDAERKGMNPIRFTVDASPESTKGLSIAAGAFWDIQSDQNQAQDRAAQVGVLDSPMSYSAALGTTLNRIRNAMHEQSAVPDVSPEALQGVVSSGKTLKAIYWDLIVRCDEKMLAWRPALESMCHAIIDSAKLYPNVLKQYSITPLQEVLFTVRVDNQYSLPEDEVEEKTMDLAEVSGQTMSKKSYMKKWRGLTDEDADAELKQIAEERQLLEDSFSAMMGPITRASTGQQTEEEEDEEEEKE